MPVKEFLREVKIAGKQLFFAKGTSVKSNEINVDKQMHRNYVGKKIRIITNKF